MFDTLMVFLKDFFEKCNLKKKAKKKTTKHAELPSIQRVNVKLNAMKHCTGILPLVGFHYENKPIQIY